MPPARAMLLLLAAIAGCASSQAQRPPGEAPSPPPAGTDAADGRSRRAAQERDGRTAAPAAEPEGRLNGIVAAHNELRARHCAPPLSWSRELARVAQGWADSLASRGCAFEHNPGVELGENLAMFGPVGSASPARVVRGWYDEVRDYRFDRARFSMDTGHFTQVVWVGTTELGCGAAVCGDVEIWVCNYAPAGNVLGHFEENVRPEGCGSH